MTRSIQLILAAAAAALLVGCGWPSTKMEPVGSTQVQTQQQQPAKTATDDSNQKKTNG